MNAREAALLCRYVKAACPQQQFDEFTPDAWGDLLGDLRFEDCKEAAKRVAQVQPFVAPAEIRTEVKRIRRQRLVDFGELPDPPRSINSANTAAVQAWQRDITRRIADGEPITPEPVVAGITHDNDARARVLELRRLAAADTRTGDLGDAS